MNKKVTSFIQVGLKRKRIVLPVLLIAILVVVALLYSKNTSGVKQQGIYLSGSLKNIRLNKLYTYQVEVVSDQSYKNAVIVFTVPESAYRKVEEVNLVAKKPLTKNLSVIFESTTGMGTEGVVVSVDSPPSSLGSHLLFSKNFPVNPASHQLDGSLPKHSSTYTSSVAGE